jgi:hypothetical protein
MGTLAAPPYATQVDVYFNDQLLDVVEIGEVSAYIPGSPVDFIYYIVWDQLDTPTQQRLLDHVDLYGGTVPFAAPVNGFQNVLYTSPVAGGDATGLDDTAFTAASHTFIYGGAGVAGGDATELPLDDGAVTEITEFVVRAADSSPAPLGGTHFTLSSPTPTDYYVWYNTPAVAEVSDLTLNSIPAGDTHLLLSDPTTDYYVWFADLGRKQLTEFNFSTQNIEGGDHFTLTASGNDYYVWFNDGTEEVFEVDFSGGAGAALVEGTYWTFSDSTGDFYVWYDRPEVAVEFTIDTAGVDGSTLTGGEHLVFSTPSTDYYIWFQVDGVGTDPAPGGTGLLVVVNSTDTDINLSESIEQAIRNTGDFLVTDTDQTVITALAFEGGVPLTVPADVDSGVTVTQLVAGRAAGVDPAAAGTGLRVELEDGNTDADALVATLLVVDTANVTPSRDGDVLTVTVNTAADVTDAANVDSGLALTVLEQGAAGSTDPAPGGTGIEVVVSGNETSADLAELSASAMATALAGDAVVTQDFPTIVRVVDESVGPQTPASNVDSGVSIVIGQLGTTGTPTDPAPGGTGIQVDFVSGVAGDTLEDVAANVAAEINALADFTAVQTGNTVRVTNANAGAVTPAADVDSGVGVAQVVAGVDASTDPAPGGTGIQVDIEVDTPALEIATLTKEAIDGAASADFVTTIVGGRLTIENVDAGDVPDSTNGDTNFSIRKVQEGVDATPSVYTATIYVNSTPNAISVDASAAATFADLINEINADLTGATATIDVDGNITVTADVTGPGQSVFIKDTDLFRNTAGNLRAGVPVAGEGVLYPLTLIVDGVEQKLELVGENVGTFTDLLGEIDAQSGTTLSTVDANGNVRISTLTVGGDETSAGSVHVQPTGVFEQTTGFAGYGIPQSGANDLIDSLFLTQGQGGDALFFKLPRVGRPPKPLVANGVNSTTNVYYNGSAWVRVIDDTPV